MGRWAFLPDQRLQNRDPRVKMLGRRAPDNIEPHLVVAVSRWLMPMISRQGISGCAARNAASSMLDMLVAAKDAEVSGCP